MELLPTLLLQTVQSEFPSFLSFRSCLEMKWLFIATSDASHIKAYFVKGRSY